MHLPGALRSVSYSDGTDELSVDKCILGVFCLNNDACCFLENDLLNPQLFIMIYFVLCEFKACHFAEVFIWIELSNTELRLRCILQQLHSFGSDAGLSDSFVLILLLHSSKGG
jgi:hypothetical protein